MFKPTLFVLATAAVLSFCDTAEDRAERHFQSGMQLLEEGDVDRALVEFRNVFRLDGMHREARLHYADTERARGNIREATGQYLRLVEQYPDSLPGQRALAELALEANDWDAVRRHATLAAELDPEDRLVQALTTSLAYRDALLAEDSTAARAAIVKARALVEEDPDLLAAHRLIIDDLVRQQDWTAALSAIDAALAQHPTEQQLYTTRLAILGQLGETREIAAQLEEMIARFPDDPNVPATYVRWHLSQGDTEAAKSFLRDRAEEEPREVDNIVTFIRFLSELEGLEAAHAELDRILDTDPPERNRLVALRAGFRFDMGERDVAISDLQNLVEGSEPSDERRSIMVMLAKMLEETGNNVGARALVEEVLEEDRTQTEALKMRAARLIATDRVDEAIVALRSVIGQDPNDAEAMTLMAQAHERAGSRDLMAEMLRRAVEASNNAPDEAIRYARYLVSQGSLRSAESILINALRLAPGNATVLSSLGEVYLREEDWGRLDQVIETLRRLDGTAPAQIANELTARQLAAQDRQEELLGFLDQLSTSGEGGVGAVAALMRSRFAEGDIEGARTLAEQAVADNPDDLDARILLASVQAVTGEIDVALATFHDLTSEAPQESRLWLALYNLYQQQGDAEAARAALQDGLEAAPDDLQINWMMASILEREGDIEGAIGIYEHLYGIDSSNVVIANNLASLLSTGREDAESLERAHNIARRLRGRDVPAFQDTYGWIAFQRGDLETAIPALEAAAAGLPNEITVQYHLARAYAAQGQDADALAQFRRVREMAPDGVELGFMTEVEAEILRLSEIAEDENAQN